MSADQSTDDFYTFNSQSVDLSEPDNLGMIRTPEIAAIEDVEAWRPMTDEEHEKVWALKRAEHKRIYPEVYA